MLLLEDVDLNFFECQLGDLRGRVPKCHLNIITPLSPSVPTKATPQVHGQGLVTLATRNSLWQFSNVNIVLSCCFCRKRVQSGLK